MSCAVAESDRVTLYVDLDPMKERPPVPSAFREAVDE